MARGTRSTRPTLGLLALGTSLVVVGALAGPASGAAPASPAAAPAAAAPGTNLLANGDAEVGSGSLRGYDEVIVPGWSVAQGLPTVVAYGAKGGDFPKATSPSPPHRGTNFFAGGAGGTSVLTQVVSLVQPSGAALGAGTTYTFDGWLGGLASSPESQSVQLVFRGSAGQALATATVGPITRSSRGGVTEYLHESRTEAVPAGTVAVVVSLVMTTPATNYDSRHGSIPGYNRSYADNLSFTVSTPVRSPVPLAPPTTAVPAYDHVFLVMMENQDRDSIIGNTARAPYLNSLLSKGVSLSSMYGEVHPSDPNYLALSAGTTFRVMSNPIEDNPAYTLDAPNIGDLVENAGKTWRAYYQSANGPCDNTVHPPYYNDDLPFLFFKDIKENAARCASHLVPLPQMAIDLKSTATTPSFSWWGYDDCYDMEGCGIKAGDTALAQDIGNILASPAWKTQRSLLVVTFDEDGYDLQRPAQLIPTIVLASTGVPMGTVNTTRYDHYNLLRTIEGVLGLGTLTQNDAYAQPMADLFH
jgi:Phosphoesterase family